VATKNQVELTFAGDEKQLERAADKVQQAMEKVGQSAKELADKVEQSADRTEQGFDRVGRSTRRVSDDVGRSSDELGERFDRLGERADTMDTRFMGFRDGLTGIQDSMAATGELARGNLFEGLLLVGSGVSDLGSSLYNSLIPTLKDAVLRLKAFRGALLASGAGLALAAAATAVYLVKQRNAKKDVSELTDTLDENTGAITANTRAKAFARLQEDGLADAAERLGLSLSDVTSAALGQSDAIERVNQVLERNGAFTAISQEQFAQLSESEQKAMLDAVRLRDAISGQNEQLAQAQKEWRQHNEAMGDAEGQIKDTTAAQLDQRDATLLQAKSLRELNDAIRAQTDPLFALVVAQDQVTDAQKAVDDALKEHGKKSPEYRQAVRNLAKAQLEVYSAATDVAGATDSSLLPALEQMRRDGYLSEAAFKALKGMIQQAETAAKKADGTRARIGAEIDRKRMDAVEKHLKWLSRRRVVVIETRAGHHVGGRIGSGTQVAGAAKGEYIRGPGPKGVDSVLRMVAPGEMIVSASDVDKAGGPEGFQAIIDALRSPQPARPVVPSMAALQAVQRPAPVVPASVPIELRITGSGPAYSWIHEGVRHGKIKLVAGATRVTVA
jgi:hypothetical protein